jgi:hypothetical protein
VKREGKVRDCENLKLEGSLKLGMKIMGKDSTGQLSPVLVVSRLLRLLLMPCCMNVVTTFGEFTRKAYYTK